MGPIATIPFIPSIHVRPPPMRQRPWCGSWTSLISAPRSWAPTCARTRSTRPPSWSSSADLGTPQLEGFDFSRPFNLIYGAGGFSGLLAGLVMSRLVDERGANIARIYGCSAGVLNGLFHAVALASRRHPDLYTPAAAGALADLEDFFQRISPKVLYSVNKTPRSLYRALVNFGPLRRELARYLERWTGRPRGETITFSEIQLPFYAAGARGSDGYLDVFGLPDGLEMDFAGRTAAAHRLPHRRRGRRRHGPALLHHPAGHPGGDATTTAAPPSTTSASSPPPWTLHPSLFSTCTSASPRLLLRP